MAVARPLITQWARSYEANIGRTEVLGWVQRGDARGLAETVRKWLSDPDNLYHRGKATRALFEQHFGPEVQRKDLMAIVDRVLPIRHDPQSENKDETTHHPDN